MKTPLIRMCATLLTLGTASTLSTGAISAEGASKPAPAVQASIPFVDHRNLRDWQADGRDGLWIQDQRRNWYYAKVLGPCIGLDWALTIGFDTGGASGQLDRFSSIIVPQEGRCQFTSLTRSDPPPPSVKKKEHKVTAEKTETPN